MSKNFDQARKERQDARSIDERTFTIGGETFVVASGVHPDVIRNYDDLKASDTAGRTIEVVDQFVIDMLEGDDVEARWRAVRAQRQNPIELDDLLELSKWLMEAATGRPTGPPGDSSPGRTTTEEPSMVGSSSPDAPAG